VKLSGLEALPAGYLEASSLVLIAPICATASVFGVLAPVSEHADLFVQRIALASPSVYRKGLALSLQGSGHIQKWLGLCAFQAARRPGRSFC
jgi:hypothetical protein